jgi:hypothetical protein
VSCGRCTIAEVVEMDKFEYQQVIGRLVRHFVDDLGAPTSEAAGAVAEEEAAYTAELCDSFPECGSRLSVLRAVMASGNTARCSSD